MYELKIIVSVILILAVVWGIQWMFHGFPTGN
jgi:hypothetical protein